MPAVFHCSECHIWCDEEDLSPDSDYWVCRDCYEPCDCGSRKCEECGPRMSVCVDDNLTAADLREMKEMDPAAFDESFPDDCDDPNCFQGWEVKGEE